MRCGAGTAGPAVAPVAALTEEDSAVAAVAASLTGAAVEAVTAVSAVAAVTEQQAGIATIGVGCGSGRAVADQILPRHRIDELVDLLTQWAVDPGLSIGV
ncbi:MAG: hypothetical protein F6Q13_14935 [Mycobacterium sp.]|nr:MAG: hypothetical protein F6Q13_14935 [Mycobacterium sp.]